jgi:hypothetical protein
LSFPDAPIGASEGASPATKIDEGINFCTGRANPESITTIGSMDSGRAIARPE